MQLKHCVLTNAVVKGNTGMFCSSQVIGFGNINAWIISLHQKILFKCFLIVCFFNFILLQAAHLSQPSHLNLYNKM